MNKILDILNSKIISPIYKVTSKVPDIFKTITVAVSIFGILVIQLLVSTEIITWRYLYTTIIDSLLMLLICFVCLPKKLDLSNINIPLAILWYTATALMTLSGLLVSEDNLLLAFLLLIIFPAVYVFSNFDETKILHKGVICSFISYLFFIIIFSLIKYPVITYQYSGVCTNTNFIGMMLASVCCICLIRFHEISIRKKFIKSDALYAVCFGLSIYFSYYSSSRATLASVICIIAIYGLFELITHRKMLLKTIACALCGVIFVTAVMSAYRAIIKITNNNPPSPSSDETTIPAEPSSDKVPVTTEPATDAQQPPVNTNNLLSRISFNGKTLDQYLTGRLTIWEHFLGELNLFGHDECSFYFAERNTNYTTTHSSYIQVLYDYGIIAGSLYILLIMALFVYSVIYAFRNKNSKYCFTPLLSISLFAVLSLTASTLFMFQYIQTLFMFLTISPLFVKRAAPVTSGNTLAVGNDKTDGHSSAPHTEEIAE